MINALKELLRIFQVNLTSDNVTVKKPVVFEKAVTIPDLALEAGDIALANGKVLIGGAAGKAVAQTVGTDATLSAAGALTIADDAVTYAKMQNTAAGFKVLGKKDTGVGAIEEITMAAGQVLAKTGTGDVSGQKVKPALTEEVPIGLNFGVPAANVANRFVESTNMKVGAYTVANAAPGDSLCHGITVTHAAVGAADTLGTIIVDGTDYNDAVIQDIITPLSGTIAYGVKAFKTVTAVTGAGWVIAEGNDTITVGFGGLIGLPVVLPAAADLVMATHGVAILNAPTVTVGATIEACTIDLAAAGDGSKRLRIFYQN